MSTPRHATSDSLERLRIWAAGGAPDVPGAQHRYHAACPFCNDTRHATAQALLAIVEAAANLRSSAEECDGWDALQAALTRAFGVTAGHDATACSGGHSAPPVAERDTDREYGP